MMYDVVVLHTSGNETASGNSRAFPEFKGFDYGVFSIESTVVGGTSPTLDVDIERFNPIEGTWNILFSFAQITDGASVEEIEKSPIYGGELRAKWVIGGTDSPNFTFSVISEVWSSE